MTKEECKNCHFNSHCVHQDGGREETVDCDDCEDCQRIFKWLPDRFDEHEWQERFTVSETPEQETKKGDRLVIKWTPDD